MIEAFDEKGKNLTHIVTKNFDFRPQAIIERLDLRRPIYQETATYGHFGVAYRPWEKNHQAEIVYRHINPNT